MFALLKAVQYRQGDAVMSFIKKDRIVQSKSGKTFPRSPQLPLGSTGFASGVAEALRREYADRPGGIKIVARLTRTNERAVKNWFSGKNGPSGEHLIVLAQHCDQVLEAFLLMAARGELVTAKSILAIRTRLKQLSPLIDEL